MIDWVNAKMVMWGDWASRRDEGATGYPRVSPSFRLMGASNSNYDAIVLVESDAVEIEQAMQRVREQRPELYEVGFEWYVKGVPVTTVATQLRCHRNTVANRIDALHVIVANLLCNRISKEVQYARQA